MFLIISAIVVLLLFFERYEAPQVTVYDVKYDVEGDSYVCLFKWKGEERQGYFFLEERSDYASLSGDEKFYVAGLDCSDGYWYLIKVNED